MNQKEYLKRTLYRVNRMMIKSDGRDMNLFDAALALQHAIDKAS